MMIYNFFKVGFCNLYNNPSLGLITFLNIGFFMLVQIIFFYLIASKQLDTIIKSKIDILNNFKCYDTVESNYLDSKISTYVDSDDFIDKKLKSQETKKKRMEVNKKILFEKLKFFLIPILIIIISYFLYFIWSYIKYKNTDKYKCLSKSDQILIFFVLFAFSTELIFYFTIVRNYQFTGDMEIINILYKSIASNFNKPY
jgi:hypothetical protein